VKRSTHKVKGAGTEPLKGIGDLPTLGAFCDSTNQVRAISCYLEHRWYLLLEKGSIFVSICTLGAKLVIEDNKLCPGSKILKASKFAKSGGKSGDRRKKR